MLASPASKRKRIIYLWRVEFNFMQKQEKQARHGEEEDFLSERKVSTKSHA